MSHQVMQHQQPQSARATYVEPLVDDVEVAKMIGASLSFVRQDRVTRRHKIPYVQVGRSVRYRPSAIEAWIRLHTVADGPVLA